MRLGITGLVLSLALNTATLHAEVYSSPQSAQALKVGDAAPSFTVRRVDNSLFEFSPAHLARPQVLIFYRGGWCPYCNLQLSDMHTVEPKLRAKGFAVLFLSTDQPALLYSSPQDKALSYLLLSDNELKAAEAMHVAYHVDDTTYAQLLGYGVNLEKTTGNALHELPVPSVFVIDKAGIIRFVYSNPDFKVRLSAADVWEAAKTVSAR